MKRRLAFLTLLLLLLAAVAYPIGANRSASARDCCAVACEGLTGDALKACIRACTHEPGGPCPVGKAKAKTK